MRNRPIRKKLFMAASAGGMAFCLWAAPVQGTSLQLDAPSVAQAGGGSGGEADSGGGSGGPDRNSASSSGGPGDNGSGNAAGSSEAGLSEAKAHAAEPAQETLESIGGLY